VVIHLALLAVAALALPLSIASGWGEPPASGYAFWLLGLFAASIGLPFFALAANNPLLQAWFVRTGHPERTRPVLPLCLVQHRQLPRAAVLSGAAGADVHAAQQSAIWTGGYGLLFLLIAACGALLLRSPPVEVREAGSNAPAPSWTARLRWVFLAAVPSGLLIAVTAHISTTSPPRRCCGCCRCRSTC